MTRITDTLTRIARTLDQVGAPWALVGGLAVGMRVEPRNTRDVDVCAAVRDDVEAEALSYTLTGLGYRRGTVLEQTATGRMATVRVQPPGQGPRGVVSICSSHHRASRRGGERHRETRDHSGTDGSGRVHRSPHRAQGLGT